MPVSDRVTMERIWWCVGPIPVNMRTRFPQDVVDPPAGGYHSVLVERPGRSDAKYARVFDPCTGWHREMTLESMELAGAIPQTLDVPRTIARIQKVFELNDRLGVGMSFAGANHFLGLLGAEPCVRTREEEEPADEKPKAEKPAKVDVRAGLIQASDIAAKLKIEPRILRDACRKLSIPKPAHGWAGPQAWADDIEARVKTWLSQKQNASTDASATGQTPSTSPPSSPEPASGDSKTRRTISGKKPAAAPASPASPSTSRRKKS